VPENGEEEEEEELSQSPTASSSGRASRAADVRPKLKPLRQLWLLERMDELLRPKMSVMRQPLVLAQFDGAGLSEWRREAIPAGCNRNASDIGHVFLESGRFRTVTFANPSRHFRVSNETLLLSPKFSLPDPAVQITCVSCGKDHIILLDSDGHPWALGDPRAAGVEIDMDDTAATVPAARPPPLLQATQVAALWTVKLKKVVCGNGHTVAMSSSGDVYTWGRALASEDEGSGSSGWRLPDPEASLPGEAVDIAAGERHVAVACLTGDMYSWGDNHTANAREIQCLGRRMEAQSSSRLLSSRHPAVLATACSRQWHVELHVAGITRQCSVPEASSTPSAMACQVSLDAAMEKAGNPLS